MYVCACVHGNDRVVGHTCICLHMHDLEVDVGYLLQPFNTLVFEPASLAEPGAPEYG